MSSGKQFMNFQSHYGLILSVVRNLESGLSVSLSIPLWSDFIGTTHQALHSQNGSFQSHYGLILSYAPTREALDLLAAFNPTMVWFYLKQQETYSGGKEDFQSHYGLILSKDLITL